MAELKPEQVVITAAIVGAEVTREQNQFLPISPKEIAEEAKRCVEAGAAVIHLHVREADGTPSQNSALFLEAVAAIRETTDAVVQVSTGGAVGMDAEERMGGLLADPEMATLNCGSVNFGDAIFENSFPIMRKMARAITSAECFPELEVYEIGHWDNAMRLRGEGVLPEPFHVQFVLGVPGAAGARASVLRFMVGELPEGTHWSVAGIGRHEFPMAELALEMGGHVRVGLEDNIYLDRGVPAEGSAPLVQRAVKLAHQRGRTPVSVEEMREVLGCY